MLRKQINQSIIIIQIKKIYSPKGLIMKRRILVINPNTAISTTDAMQEACRKIAFDGTEVDAKCLLENNNFSSYKVFSYVDLSICQLETIKLAWKNRENYDGIIIAGFSDVGLDATRELLEIPILGIAETSYYLASMVSHRFSVLTGTSKWTSPKDDYTKALCIHEKVSSFRPYFEWDENDDFETLKKRLIEVAKLCIKEDKAEAIVLGGGPLVGYGRLLEKELGVPVIDPTIATLKIMESFIALGLKHSKINKWKEPLDKLGDASGFKPYNRKWLED